MEAYVSRILSGENGRRLAVRIAQAPDYRLSAWQSGVTRATWPTESRDQGRASG